MGKRCLFDVTFILHLIWLSHELIGVGEEGFAEA
jgi:hypothetical protein